MLFWLPLAAPAVAAPAAGPIFQPFDAATLTAPETRLVQTALAAAGDYRGALDGVWGGQSQGALDAYAERTFQDAALNVHAAALVLAFLDEVTANRWDYRLDPELGVALALPTAALGPAEPEEGGRRWWARAGALTVLTHRFDAPAAAAWHDAAVAANARPAALVTLRRRDALVTSGELADGRSFHVRSDRVGEHWATVHLAGDPEDAAVINLIAASIRPGPPPPWTLPQGGRLAALVAETARLVEQALNGKPLPLTAAAAPAAEPPGDAGLPAATGSGFYVAARLLVTAEHVVRDCRAIVLPDGTQLALIAADPDLDLALLEAPVPGLAWLALAEGARARLGQRLHAAGFPYYSIAGTSLHLTGGNVSALAGVDDDRRFFSFTAPVQPGNSGGPLIGPDGRVLGVAIARLSESYIVEATGSLPQNVNYALGTAELAAFLARQGLAASAGGLGGFDLDAGAPEGFEAAVVPIVCE